MQTIRFGLPFGIWLPFVLENLKNHTIQPLKSFYEKSNISISFILCSRRAGSNLQIPGCTVQLHPLSEPANGTARNQGFEGYAGGV
jgi:hypothetical protein